LTQFDDTPILVGGRHFRQVGDVLGEANCIQKLGNLSNGNT
jgi:hypothetical protein